MKKLFLILFLIFPTSLFASVSDTSIYVDSVNGNNSYTGLDAAHTTGTTGPKAGIQEAYDLIGTGCRNTIFMRGGVNDAGRYDYQGIGFYASTCGSFTNGNFLRNYQNEYVRLINDSYPAAVIAFNGIHYPAHDTVYFSIIASTVDLQTDRSSTILLDCQSHANCTAVSGIVGDYAHLENIEIINGGLDAAHSGFGIKPSEGDHWELINLNVHHNYGHGAYMDGNYFTVIGGRYHHNGIDKDGNLQSGKYGIQFYNASGAFVSSHNLMYDVEFDHNQDYGWIFQGTDCLAFNIYSHDNAAVGYNSFSQTVAATVYNSTIDGYQLLGNGNILTNVINTGVHVDSASGTVVTTSINANPGLDANGDLLGSASTAIGQGTNLTSLMNTALDLDIYGVQRHATNPWDLGKSVYSGTCSPMLTSVSPTSGTQGATLNVDLFGNSCIAFTSMSTVAFSGTGITNNSFTFISSTHVRENITIAGDATLSTRDITSEGVTLDDQFTIVAATCGDHLTYTTQPTNASLGGSLGDVTLEIRDGSNVICASASNNVTIAKTGGATFGTLNGTLTRSAINGVVVFNNLYISTTTGSGTLTATSSGITSAVSDSITISGAVTGCQTTRCTYYISWSDPNASDSNDGLTKQTPWKRAPNMGGVLAGTGPGYYGNSSDNGICNGQACNLSGYSFIFKGGDTWPRSISETGFSCGWCIGTYGTGNVVDTSAVYYGVDETWYSGVSWSQPIFDSGGIAEGPQCHSTMASSVMVPYTIVDNFEFKGIYWDGTCNGRYLDTATSGGIRLVSPGVWCRDACLSNTFYVKVLKNAGGTNFSNGVSTANFGAGITVNSFTVVSTTAGFASITVTGGAADGYRDVSITTGGTTITATNGFRVLNTHIVYPPSTYLSMSGDNVEVKNIRVHSWSHGSAADGTLDEGQCNLLSGSGTNASFHHIVMDGYDSLTATAGTGYNTPTTWQTDGFDTSCSGMIYPGPPIQHHNYYAWLINGSLAPQTVAFYNNVCHHIGGSFATAIDPLVVLLNTALSISLPTNYQDVHDQCFEDLNSSADSIFANNLIHDVEAGVLVWLAPISPAKVTVFNNIFYHNNNSGTNVVCTTQDFGATPAGACNWYNNTMESSQLQMTAGLPSTTDTSTFKNNHFIGASSSTSSCDATHHCTQSNNTLHASIAVANTNGYSVSTDSPYYPTLITGGTIQTGTNLTSLCSGVVATLCDGSTIGIVVNTSNAIADSEIVSAARPAMGAWDGGAYFVSSIEASFTITLSTCDQGATCAIPMIGTGTLWTNGTSICSFQSNADITVNSTVVADNTHATCNITVGVNAAPTSRTIIMTTSAAIESDANALTITIPAAPVVTRGSSLGMRIIR